MAVTAGIVGWSFGGTAAPPRYRELGDLASTVLGRDLVIDARDAVPERIEQVVAVVADSDTRPLLVLNVFTSEAAARARRQLIAQGRFPKPTTIDDLDAPDVPSGRYEDVPDPTEWKDVNAAFVGIYTRDPARGIHQLSVCLNDPDHSHCTVRRYPLTDRP